MRWSVRVHGIVGGIPMYLAWWDQAAPLAAAVLPGAPHELRIAICARERVTNVPDGLLASTADDIFS
ncbi:MAG: hypothetical protein ACRDTT_13450 [Pseudonocardiaceae bacterium]